MTSVQLGGMRNGLNGCQGDCLGCQQVVDWHALFYKPTTQVEQKVRKTSWNGQSKRFKSRCCSLVLKPLLNLQQQPLVIGDKLLKWVPKICVATKTVCTWDRMAGILIVNLGTPDNPQPPAVAGISESSYLIQRSSIFQQSRDGSWSISSLHHFEHSSLPRPIRRFGTMKGHHC